MNDNTWRPTATPAALAQRSEILWRIRALFHLRGFCEVQTPTLSRDTVVDRYIEPVSLAGQRLGIDAFSETEFFLQTSPEFSMKRLMAAGMEAIYQIGPAFRAGEQGDFHNPEFSMLEWYRRGDGLQAGVQLLSDIVAAGLETEPAEQLTYREAFLQYAGCDPLEDSVEQLANVACERLPTIDATFANSRDAWLNLLLDAVVQPRLGKGRPCILTHYPASQSALAQLSAEDPRTAERFELFIDGVELANGYHELTDASELEARNAQVNAQRTADGHPPLPEESLMLDAMRWGLPSCSGCALGLDRLVMVALGTSQIADVLAFPIQRA